MLSLGEFEAEVGSSTKEWSETGYIYIDQSLVYRPLWSVKRVLGRDIPAIFSPSVTFRQHLEIKKRRTTNAAPAKRTWMSRWGYNGLGSTAAPLRRGVPRWNFEGGASPGARACRQHPAASWQRGGHLSAGVWVNDVQRQTAEPIAPPASPGAAWQFCCAPPQDLPRAAGAIWVGIY